MNYELEKLLTKCQQTLMSIESWISGQLICCRKDGGSIVVHVTDKEELSELL